MIKAERVFMNVSSTQKDEWKRSLKSLQPGLSLPHFPGVLSSSVFSGEDQTQLLYIRSSEPFTHRILSLFSHHTSCSLAHNMFFAGILPFMSSAHREVVTVPSSVLGRVTVSITLDAL
jgi:hypothetical protein